MLHNGLPDRLFIREVVFETFPVWGQTEDGCMNALTLSHDARGASMSWPVRPAAGRTGRAESAVKRQVHSCLSAGIFLVKLFSTEIPSLHLFLAFDISFCPGKGFQPFLRDGLPAVHTLAVGPIFDALQGALHLS